MNSYRYSEMNEPIDINNVIEQRPISFPDNLDSMFEQYQHEETIPFRDLPLGDYKIISERTFKTKDKRDWV